MKYKIYFNNDGLITGVIEDSADEKAKDSYASAIEFENSTVVSSDHSAEFLYFNCSYSDGHVVEQKHPIRVHAANLKSALAERKRAYPSIQDQLDTLYHGGFDAWRAQIRAVKEQYPKPE
jgi:hypothetical protein